MFPKYHDKRSAGMVVPMFIWMLLMPFAFNFNNDEVATRIVFCHVHLSTSSSSRNKYGVHTYKIVANS